MYWVYTLRFKLPEIVRKNVSRVEYIIIDKIYSRVGTEGSSDNEEGDSIVVHSPHPLVEAPGVQVPDVKTLGQAEPAGEVFGVVHLDEEDIGPVLVASRREIVLTAGRLLVTQHSGATQLRPQQLLVSRGEQAGRNIVSSGSP